MAMRHMPLLRPFAVIALALLTLVVAGCGGSPAEPPTTTTGSYPFRLRIVPEGGEKTKLLALEDRSATVTGPSGDEVTFTVVSVAEESATVSTSEPVTVEDGSESSELTVAKGEPATFESASGTSWTVTYEEMSVE